MSLLRNAHLTGTGTPIAGVAAATTATTAATTGTFFPTLGQPGIDFEEGFAAILTSTAPPHRLTMPFSRSTQVEVWSMTTQSMILVAVRYRLQIISAT